MKKKYETPLMEIVTTTTDSLLYAWSVNGDVDVDGLKDPSSRRYHNSLWDSDEEDW